jgi:hypothetical protein
MAASDVTSTIEQGLYTLYITIPTSPMQWSEGNRGLAFADKR